MSAANFVLISICGLFIGSACAATQDSIKPTVSETKTVEPARLTPFPEINCSRPGGKTNQSGSEKTLLEIQAWQEANLQTLRKLSDPELIENVVRLTSAGLLSDDTPMILADRDCWSEFFTAFSYSVSKDKTSDKKSAKLKEAKKAASAWLVCVEARQPELLEEAKKIRLCLP